MSLLKSCEITFKDNFDANSFPTQYVRIFSDFLSSVGEFLTSTSGTGANANIAGVDPGNHPGIIQLNTGTTTTGTVRLGCGSSAGLTAILFGSGVWKFETDVQFNSLSSDTDTFFLNTGFSDASTPVDGVYFRYIHNENSGQFTLNAVSNSTKTTVNTNVNVVLNQWYRLTIIINASATSATFYIDGTSAGTITTNIPSATGRQTGINVWLTKSAGTSNNVVSIDYVDVICLLTTTR